MGQLEGNRKRLDVLLVERGIAASREKAKEMIKSGDVYLNSQRVFKAGLFADACDIIEYKGEVQRFVSRGGLKLQKAVDNFGLCFCGYLCIDVGASTGGFTDCMLQNGASLVYAVDSGTGQLSEKLLCDKRVINLEKTNFRYITTREIPQQLDFAGVDVSFISLQLILPALAPLLKVGGEAVCLIKPQFEAGRESVGKKGVVRDADVHTAVIKRLCAFAQSCAFSVGGLDFSPIKGPEGNIEYLLYIKKEPDVTVNEPDVAAVVAAAHEKLRG